MQNNYINKLQRDIDNGDNHGSVSSKYDEVEWLEEKTRMLHNDDDFSYPHPEPYTTYNTTPLEAKEGETLKCNCGEFDRVKQMPVLNACPVHNKDLYDQQFSKQRGSDYEAGISFYNKAMKEKKGYCEPFPDESNDDLHDEAERLLCRLMPPEEHGENEDCDCLMQCVDELRKRANSQQLPIITDIDWEIVYQIAKGQDLSDFKNTCSQLLSSNQLVTQPIKVPCIKCGTLTEYVPNSGAVFCSEECFKHSYPDGQ